MADNPTPRHGFRRPDQNDTGWGVKRNEDLLALDNSLPWSCAGNPNGAEAAVYIGQPIWDATNDKLYICTFVGDATTTEWKLVNDDLVAGSVTYDNTDSGMVAENVQDAIDELDTDLGVAEGEIEDLQDAVDVLEDSTVVTLTSGAGTKTIDLANKERSFLLVVSGGTNTIVLNNPKASGQEDIITFKLQNAGSQTLNWPSSVDWPGGTAPDFTASGWDEVALKTINGGTTYSGLVALDIK